MLTKLANAMAWLAGGCLLLLMAVTFVDVVGRAFDRPLKFQVEVTQLLMGLTIFFGAVMTTLRHGHIAVDIIVDLLPPVARTHLVRLTALIATLFFGVCAWRLFDKGLDFLGDGLRTDILFLPVYPVPLLMGVASSICAIIAFLQLLRPELGAMPTDTLPEHD